jgi:ABC-2 type transport system ATP-binding protein
MPAIIETHHLTKTFKNGKKLVEAVRGLDLEVERGQIFGFLGPNGAGKTTTLKMLSTMLRPDGGQASVAGYNLLKQPARVRERIGMVSQSGGVDDSASARENLILQARLYGLNKTAARQSATRMLKQLELEDFADRPAKTYSGGQRRRLDLALGLVHQPDLLFLDEPTAGLDPQSRARLWEEVRQLREMGTTVFLTTHYLDEADKLCDRLAIIDGGEIVAEGTVEALKREIAGDVVTLGIEALNEKLPTVKEVLGSQAFVRELQAEAGGLRLYVERGEEALPYILRVLDGLGLSARTIQLAQPSLDDVFLKQTGRSLREAGN